ncbi:MAG: hypothetical protein AAF125_09200 [Chloroflexota bacterium]
MPTSNIFTWKDGAGWLVLSGGADGSGSVRAAALERIAADGALVCLSFGGVDDDAVLDDLAELGGPAGYLVNVLTEDDATIRNQIGEASMVIISADLTSNTVRSNLMGAAIEGLELAYGGGAVILAEGEASSVFGSYMPDSDGFEWLERGFVQAGVTSAAESEMVREMVVRQPDVIVLGLALGAAMVFGGTGSVETWGNQQVTITLGNAYTSS